MVKRLPWHGPVWRQIQLLRSSERLPHALLLIGPRGLGKQIFAQRLAAALLCEAQTREGDACGSCRACRLFSAGSHPDCTFIQPQEPGKAIKIDQIRVLRDFFELTPQYGGYKIALLEPADCLNAHAANSLLKTLEEPPGDSLLLLVTAQPARLPATVRSRCQTLCFAPPPITESAAWLASHIATGGLEPQILLDIAGGAPLAALQLADPQRWQRRRQLIESYQHVLTGATDPLRAAELWMQGNLAENLRWLVGWHTDLIRLKMSADPPYLENPDLRVVLRSWAERRSLRALFERLDAAIRLSILCSTIQANAQLSLEVFLDGGIDA